MTKKEQIEQLLAKPFEIGDEVIYTTKYRKSESVQEGKGKKKQWKSIIVEKEFSCDAKITKVEQNRIEVLLNSYETIPSEIVQHGNYENKLTWALPKELTYVTNHLGSDPFVKQDWNSRIQFYQSDIDQVLWRVGYDRREKSFIHEKLGNIIVPELDWNPTIIDEKGNEVIYQRPFIWTLEEKQLLIDSIYNNIEIGKIVLRNRSWSWVENRIKKGTIEHTTFKQIVDGKQRCNTILEFITNSFPDSYGNFWGDLSSIAQRKFFSFRYITYGELGETATDKDVLNTFMCINHAGKPMSKEHLEFVKSLKTKE